MATTAGVVLDTCVLVPAALRDTLLRAATRGLYRPLWTAEILNELHRTLVVDGFTDVDRADRLITTLRNAFPEALLPDGYRNLTPAMHSNPHDRHVVAAAVFAHADLIVTLNLRHFPSAALSPFQIQAQSPDAFLSDLFQALPEVACEIIFAQARGLHRPEISVDGVLRNLALSVPGFTAFVEDHIADFR